MTRGSTPTHTFQLPIETSTIKKLLITYEQLGRTVLEKTEEDVRMEGKTVCLKLTQTEAFQFKENHSVKLQIKILTNTGDLLPSKVFRISVDEILNEEVLE